MPVTAVVLCVYMLMSQIFHLPPCSLFVQQTFLIHAPIGKPLHNNKKQQRYSQKYAIVPVHRHLCLCTRRDYKSQ